MATRRDGQTQSTPPVPDGEVLRAAILALAAARGPGRTICPSEVARTLLGPNETQWRRAMKPIRAEAVRLADEGRVVLKRRGRPVDPHDFKGIYRIAIVEDPNGAPHGDAM